MLRPGATLGISDYFAGQVLAMKKYIKNAYKYNQSYIIVRWKRCIAAPIMLGLLLMLLGLLLPLLRLVVRLQISNFTWILHDGQFFSLSSSNNLG